jgi:hypothetical protein
MKKLIPSTFVHTLLGAVALADGSFYGDPPDARHPWAIHDMNRPQPPVVDPGTASTQDQPGRPPSDAVVLFGGKEADLNHWCADKPNGEPTRWIVKDGCLQCVPGSGYIRTKEEFGECQLHVEWSEPEDIQGKSQGRGNSGVFLMGQVEVQVLDNYNNPSYPDGMASAIYGINPPMVNVIRPPGKWQSYDIIFRKPVFKNGVEVAPGYMTVFVNGVLTQDHTILEGKGGHRARSKSSEYPEAGPLKLQDHGNPVRFRNIWIRPLPKRPIEGGEGSWLSEEATREKRAAIARQVREDAAKLEGKAKFLRLFESLIYAEDSAARTQASAMLADWIKTVQELPAEKKGERKGEALEVASALNYLVKHQFLPAEGSAEKKALDSLIQEQGWTPKKK